MPTLPRLVLRAVRDFDLWRGGEAVLCAVSGGPDSTALLAALLELPSAFRPRVTAAHLDHGLREAAAQDEEAVRALCAHLGVPLSCGRAEPPPRGASLEAAAREARYAFLARAARAAAAPVVAVGHQRQDRAETVLLRLGRGAGSRGLSGIRPLAPLPGAGPGLRLVRPLWGCDRTAVLEYLGARGLPWRQDESNADLARPRNRVRAEVLPALERTFGSGVTTALLRTADNLAEDDEALAVWAQTELGHRLRGDALDLGPGWGELPAAVRHRVLEAWWMRATGRLPLGRRLVEQAPRGVDLPGGWRFEPDASGSPLRLRRRPLPADGMPDPAPGPATPLS
jgi:tRNA(Ile)-lysidine synthase